MKPRTMRVFAEDEEPPSSTSRRNPARADAPGPNGKALPSSRRIAPRALSIPRLTISPRSRAFKDRFFPDASPSEWNDWRWQNRNRIRTLEGLARIIELSDDEIAAIRRHEGPLPVGITPYYASLLDPKDPAQALRRTVVPVLNEFERTPGESDDPLGEDTDSPVPGLVHRYPDRVLLLVTGFCSVYCRYCTRARLVGATGERTIKKTDIERALEYIESTPAVRDVLISGGDALSLDDERLDWLLARLKRIPHVEFVRIGSKQPIVQPQRVTTNLVRMLKRHSPLWMSLHFTHPDELTPEVAEACGRLADAGIPLGSQTVLLKGVNDDVDVMRKLMHGLLKIRVRPYYLYQCDPISGSAHFRTSVDKGLEIIAGLRGHTTGYAVPTYVIDAPEGGGKLPLQPDYVTGRDGDDLLLVNYAGRQYRYRDPVANPGEQRSPSQE